MKNSLEIYLLPRDATLDVNAVLSALRDETHLHADRNDPSRLVYVHRDLSLHFSVMLDESIAPARFRAAEDDDEAWADDEEDASAGDEDDEDDEDAPHDEDAGVEHPAITLSVSLLRPSFFVTEAFALARRLCERANLRAERENEAPVDAFDESSALALWRTLHAELFAELKELPPLVRWSDEASTRFASWGRGAEGLREELASAGVLVPELQPARRGDAVETLCVWRTDQPIALPRTDWVLVERVGERRGLLRRRRVDELVVPGERVWNLLKPFSEDRAQPRCLVWKNADSPPAQLSRELEALSGEPTDSVKRTELFAVLDFDVPERDVESESGVQEGSA